MGREDGVVMKASHVVLVVLVCTVQRGQRLKKNQSLIRSTLTSAVLCLQCSSNYFYPSIGASACYCANAAASLVNYTLLCLLHKTDLAACNN